MVFNKMVSCPPSSTFLPFLVLHSCILIISIPLKVIVLIHVDFTNAVEAVFTGNNHTFSQ